MTEKTRVVQVYKIVIKASAQAIWDAITKPEWTEKYAYGGRASYERRDEIVRSPRRDHRR
jgi:hypothetical protein